MKKILALCLAAAAALSLLSACGSEHTALPDGVTENEVLTETPLDSGKMTITLRAEYNVDNNSILSALKAKFPDVNFVSVFHCANETQYELRQSLLDGSAEDIVVSPNMKSVSDIAPDCLLDLSAEDFTGKYVGSALESCQINGKLYYLPGPLSVYGIVYDKTMFAEHGWQVPHSYDEFVSLVRTIDASGIRAIQPSCKYARQAQMVLTMFDYDETFGGVENYQWLLGYQSGENGMAGHMDAALKRYLELRDAGVIASGDFDVQPGNRSEMLYKAHSCAMIIENEQAERYAAEAGSDHEYGMMPFWCGNEPDSDHIMSLPGYYIGVSARLGLKGSEAKLAKVREILSYISTQEGQAAINGGSHTQISNFYDTPGQTTAFNSDIQATISKGNVVPEVELMASGNNNAAEKALKAQLPLLLSGKTDASGVMSACDAARDKALAAGLDRGEKVGSASGDFTRLETGLFIADALREKAGADIGLCLVGTTRCGTVGRIYGGDVYAADIDALSLSVGKTSGRENDQKLWLVSMTGAQIKDLLRQACALRTDAAVPETPYFAASGLRIKFAPWKDDKIVSAALSDGGALKDDGTYTVALWGWPFETPCAGTVEKVFDDTCDDILSAAVKAAGTVSPVSDGRFVLVY